MKLSLNLFAFALGAVFVSYSALASENSFTGNPASTDELRGMATLTCSGSLIRLNRNADQNVVLLTNGRCAKRHFINPGDAVINSPYDRGDILVYLGDSEPEKIAVTRLLYATMSDTDIALIELEATYAELEDRGAQVYSVSDSDADSKVGTTVLVVSGYTKQKQHCTIEKNIPLLLEDVWSTRNQVSFDANCVIEGGWAGSPMIDPTTQKIVGMVNASNTQGGICTLDNPCEIEGKSEKMAFRGRTYGQKISRLSDCVTTDGEIDLNLKGCALPAPKTLRKKTVIPTKKEATEQGKKASLSQWPSI